MEAQSWRKMKEEALMLMLMLMVWPLKTKRGDAFSWSRTSRSSTHGSPLMLRSSHVFSVSSVDCCPAPCWPRARHRPAVSRSPRARPRAPPRPPTLMLIITALGLIVRPKHLVATSA